MSSPPVKFTKMHGLGNDFVIIDAVSSHFDLNQLDISKLANRHTGIGFDQLLCLEVSEKADFSCRIFNADGSEAEQCGNGMRCIARFIHEENLSQKKSLTLETKAGIIHISVPDFDAIQVNMGQPKVLERQKKIIISPSPVTITTVSMGNPHALLVVPSLKKAPVTELGKQIATHADFPDGINVGFMEILNRNHIGLRTYERGVGETYSCGSNACAAVVAGVINDWLDRKVKVDMFFGNLWIEWPEDNAPIMMTGPAKKVYSGVF